MDGCARSPANTSINHSDETWGGEKFLALRAATVVRKATKTMPLDDPLSLIPCTYIYIYSSVPFCSFLSFFLFHFHSYPPSFRGFSFFFLYLAPHRSSILASIDARKINGHVNSFAFFFFSFCFETSLARFIGVFEIKVR